MSNSRESGSPPESADGLPREIDVTKPHSARIYDYFLGGKDHFAADRAVAEQTLRAWPSIRISARENRAFIGRAVRYLAGEAGVTQFLDIGSGLPTAGNVHEVAQDVNPAARVVYVDSDPIVLVHGKALLASKPEGRCGYVHADLLQPEKILADPVTRETLDFDRPVALILASVLHFYQDAEGIESVVRTLIGALPPGSYVAATHATREYEPMVMEGVEQAYGKSGISGQARTAREFADLVFAGLELVPPGVVMLSEWRPEPGAILPSAAEVNSNGAVARKP
jgi:hypothetical protein